MCESLPMKNVVQVVVENLKASSEIAANLLLRLRLSLLLRGSSHRRGDGAEAETEKQKVASGEIHTYWLQWRFKRNIGRRLSDVTRSFHVWYLQYNRQTVGFGQQAVLQSRNLWSKSLRNSSFKSVQKDKYHSGFLDSSKCEIEIEIRLRFLLLI